MNDYVEQYFSLAVDLLQQVHPESGPTIHGAVGAACLVWHADQT